MPGDELDRKGRHGVNSYVPIMVLGALSLGFAVFSIGAGAATEKTAKPAPMANRTRIGT